jgi:hypothetical protein
MANRQAFGRRINPQAANRPQPAAVPPPAQRAAAPAVIAPVEPALPMPDQPEDQAEDQTRDGALQDWKRARGSRFKMPWSQLSLMASLCFGIASFVLPDSVNDSVDWVLWGLAAISAYAWYTTRKKKARVTSPAAP